MKIGDIVECDSKWLPHRRREKLHGIVLCDEDSPFPGVEFPKLAHGHDLGGRVEVGRGWFVDADKLKVVEGV